MSLRYEDLISGDPILIAETCHVRSPFLWETKPTKGIGMWKYTLLLNVLACDKEDAVKFVQIYGKSEKVLDAIRRNELLENYDILTLINGTRKLLQDSLNFFIVEDVSWDESKGRFDILANSGGFSDIVGYIDRNNFDEIRKAILQMNYVALDEPPKATTFSSEKTKMLWERAQGYLKKTGKNKEHDTSMSLGNLVSKFCAISESYNLLNVYELTIYQFYDQFFQCAYMKDMRITDMAYCMHGGDKYDAQAWLKPIHKQ